MLLLKDDEPTDVFAPPVVVFCKELNPTAVFEEPVVHKFNALLPIATEYPALVVVLSALHLVLPNRPRQNQHLSYFV